MAPEPDAAAEHALILGSNQRRARNLRLAARRLGERFAVVSCAPALRTRDAGGVRYLNAAVRIRSSLPSQALRDALRAIEDEAGRMRGSVAVALDIDLVASRAANGSIVVHKPEELRREYARALLARIGFCGSGHGRDCF